MGAAAEQVLHAVEGTAAAPGADARGCSLLFVLLLNLVTVLQTPKSSGTNASHYSLFCRVHPVYKHVFSINAAPTLAFIGLPFKVKLPNSQLHLQYSIQSLLTTAAMQVVPFPQMELVARWIARVLSGRSQLPTMMAMRQDSRSHYEHLRMQGMPVRWGHPF